MIDTLYLRLEKSLSLNDLERLRNRLDNSGESFPTGGYYIFGKLKNLKITANETGVTVKNSIAVYFLDDNIQTLTRSTLEQAINRLSDDLQLPMDQAKITRVDIGCNFLMKYKPESYFPYLLECSNFNRKPYDSGVYFDHRTKSKVFYNKIESCKKDKVDIPTICKGQNLLRYEFRLLHRVADFFQMERFSAKDLYQEKNYMKLIDEYRRQYENITKLKLPTPERPDTITVKGFKEYLSNMGLYELGAERALQEYEFFKSNKIFKQPSDASNAKKELKKIFSGEHMLESPLIEELTQKIDMLKSNYR